MGVSPRNNELLCATCCPNPLPHSRCVHLLLYSRYKKYHRRPSCSIEPARIHSRAVTSQSKEMDKVKKGYETRIQQDLLTDAILGKNRIKLYQQHFQVSTVLRYCDRSTSHRPKLHINFSLCKVKQGLSQRKHND